MGIIGIQFRNLRKCDRFWYEGGNPLIRFTEAQLDEIRKVSLSKVMCDNCDTVTDIQRALFDVPDPFLNPRVPCSALPAINLDLKDHVCKVQCAFAFRAFPKVAEEEQRNFGFS